MKRIGGIFDAIWPAAALTRAAWRAARGKRQRAEVRSFLERLPEQVAAVGTALREGRFAFDGYTSFEIRDPKTRLIRAPSFRDRVVHHAIMGAAGPVLERGAVGTSCACRLGLGQHAALDHAARWVRHAEGFVKLDVSRYYDSIGHELLRLLLRRRFREARLLDLFDRLLDSYAASPGRGLPIGALTSQYLGNLFLDPFDHWVLEHAGRPGYVRYMDDMLVFGDLAGLREFRRRAVERLALMGLEVKHGGVLNRCALGVPWLGFTLYPDRTRLDARGRRRLRRRLGASERLHLRGELSEADLQARATALFAHARQADDLGWRRVVLGFSPLSRLGEAPERPEPGGPRRLLEQRAQELPLRVPQQEEAHEPQQEPGLPGLPAPRHGGARDATGRRAFPRPGRSDGRGRSQRLDPGAA